MTRQGVVDKLKTILDKEFQDDCDALRQRMSEASAIASSRRIA